MVQPRTHYEGMEEGESMSPPALHKPRVAKFFSEYLWIVITEFCSCQPANT